MMFYRRFMLPFMTVLTGFAGVCAAEPVLKDSSAHNTAHQTAMDKVFARPEATRQARDNGTRLAARIAKAGDYATLMVPAGDYDLRDVKIRRSLTLQGIGEVTLFSSRDTAKGLLNPMPGISLTVKDITFFGARSPDLNGAGIRHDGLDLTIVNCRFIENENGVLATGDDDGVITISNAAFIENGHGDGYSHGIYLSSGDTLIIRQSRFVGTKIGHHVKSLARATSVSGSILNDAKGRTSYGIDVSKGGAVTIWDNKFIQAADADNAVIINYDLSRGGDATSLTVKNNQITNYRRHGAFLRNGATSLTPELGGNRIDNKSNSPFAVTK